MSHCFEYKNNKCADLDKHPQNFLNIETKYTKQKLDADYLLSLKKQNDNLSSANHPPGDESGSEYEDAAAHAISHTPPPPPRPS